MNVNTNEMPGFMSPRKFADDAELFAMRVDHESLIAGFMRETAGIEIVKSFNGPPEFKKGQNSLINLKGARVVFSSIRAAVNPVTSLTQFKENQINALSRSNGHSMLMYLYDNNDDIELRNEHISGFYNSYFTFVYSQLNRSLNGKEAEMLSIIQTREHHTVMETKEKRGWFGKKPEEGQST